MKRPLPFIAILSLLATAAAGADTATLEVERALRESVHMPPASIELRFDGIDSTRFELLDSHFEVDGVAVERGLAVGGVSTQSQILFFAVVTPGEHLVTASLTFKEARGASLFQYVEGYRFKLPGRFHLTAQRGLVLGLRLKVHADALATDLRRRLTLEARLEPKMVAQLDDGTMPAPLMPPPLQPRLSVPEKPGTRPPRRRSHAKALLAQSSSPERPFTHMDTGRWKLRKAREGAAEVSPRALAAALEEARGQNRASPSVSENP